MRTRFVVALFACAGAGSVSLASLASRPPQAATSPAPRPAAGRPAESDRIAYPAGAYPMLTLPDGEREAIRSVLNVRGPMSYGSYVWNDAGAPPGPLLVRIDLGAQLISVFRGGHEIGSAVVLFGADGKPTPVGLFKILQKAKDYRSWTYDAPMPFMLRLTSDGVAIHASNVRQGWATHGCIGVPPAFASRLFAQAKLGDKVVIVRGTVAGAA